MTIAERVALVAFKLGKFQVFVVLDFCRSCDYLNAAIALSVIFLA